MTKKLNQLIRLTLIFTLCLSVLTGCGTKATIKSSDNNVTKESSDNAENLFNDNKKDDDTTSKKSDKLSDAKRKNVYGGVLAGAYTGNVWPDGSTFTDSDFSSRDSNLYCITDIDNDGTDELILSSSNGSMAGMRLCIFEYDTDSDELKEELVVFPALTFYDNGIILAESSHNQTYGELYPYTLYSYNSSKDTYEAVAYAESWSKELSDTSFSGDKFPDDKDKDGDGILYYIYPSDSSNNPDIYDESEYNDWYDSYLKDAAEHAIDWENLNYDNFNDYANDYIDELIVRYAEDGGDTKNDLGVLCMNNRADYNASKNALTNELDITFTEQSDGIISRGFLDNNELLSISNMNGLTINYNEKADDITMFGIYPGMSTDEAKSRLEAFGLTSAFASSYITGDGFNNYIVTITDDNGTVKEISIHNYCKYAG